MEKVEFLDSTGLGVLVGGLKRVRAHDGSLDLVCTQERILKIFRITGLTKVFGIHDTVDEAIDGQEGGEVAAAAGSPEMATVELSFTPLPAHVRTARLVATAVARRSGVEESLLDEVRLAVGEACSRAVEAHRLHCPAEPVADRAVRSGRAFRGRRDRRVPGGADAAAHARSRHVDSRAAARGLAAREVAADSAGTDSGRRPDGRAGCGPSAAVTAGHPCTGGGRGLAGIGLAVIAGLADDVQISDHGRRRQHPDELAAPGPQLTGCAGCAVTYGSLT